MKSESVFEGFPRFPDSRFSGIPGTRESKMHTSSVTGPDSTRGSGDISHGQGDRNTVCDCGMWRNLVRI